MNLDLGTILTVVVVAVAGLLVLALLMKGFGKKSGPDVSQTHVHKECTGCGWEGSVSKFHRKCPNCGDALV
jgi:hypothetical protein